jgi:putative transposase
MLLKIVYLLMRWSFGLIALVFGGDHAKDAELLVLRHENAVLRRNAGRVRYEPADRAWFAALTRFVPRRRWAGAFPVIPATLLAWHRKLAARKYNTSQRRQPGRPATVRSTCGCRKPVLPGQMLCRSRSAWPPRSGVGPGLGSARGGMIFGLWA